MVAGAASVAGRGGPCGTYIRCNFDEFGDGLRWGVLGVNEGGLNSKQMVEISGLVSGPTFNIDRWQIVRKGMDFRMLSSLN